MFVYYYLDRIHKTQDTRHKTQAKLKQQVSALTSNDNEQGTTTLLNIRTSTEVITIFI